MAGNDRLSFRRVSLINEDDSTVGDMWISGDSNFIIVDFCDVHPPLTFRVRNLSLLGAINLASEVGRVGESVQIKTTDLKIQVVQGRVYFRLRGQGKDCEDNFVVHAWELRKGLKWAVKKRRKRVQQLALSTPEFAEQSLT